MHTCPRSVRRRLPRYPSTQQCTQQTSRSPAPGCYSRWARGLPFCFGHEGHSDVALSTHLAPGAISDARSCNGANCSISTQEELPRGQQRKRRTRVFCRKHLLLLLLLFVWIHQGRNSTTVNATSREVGAGYFLLWFDTWLRKVTTSI